uniref:Uncharacterized protein n=1 Tax=Strigamia maritima TaxID=126957 RepID=T1JM57_STRMM
MSTVVLREVIDMLGAKVECNRFCDVWIERIFRYHTTMYSGSFYFIFDVASPQLFHMNQLLFIFWTKWVKDDDTNNFISNFISSKALSGLCKIHLEFMIALYSDSKHHLNSIDIVAL